MALKSLFLELFSLVVCFAFAFNANAASTTKGDVNNDGEISIADINAIIDLILGSGSNTLADVNDDGEINIADVNAIIDIILGGGSSQDNHEYVDLGLPSGTLWATCNVGANTPEEYGDYFAWGETESKNSYFWDDYKWFTDGKISKYCYDDSNSYNGIVDDKMVLDVEDDAAYINWGSSWRMPTKAQRDELDDYCTRTYTQLNGVNGFMLTGPNGNSIFLPKAGYKGIFPSSAASYLTRSLAVTKHIPGYINHNNETFYSISFSSSDPDKVVSEIGYRYYGYPVRAVRWKPIYVEQRTLDMGVVPKCMSKTATLNIVNDSPEEIKLVATTYKPFSFKYGNQNHNRSIISVNVPGNSSISVELMFTATTTPGQYSDKVHISYSEPEMSQCDVPILASVKEDPDWVELGLPSGTQWATCNVGANVPKEYGNYFAWGETTPKDYYYYDSYKWYTVTWSSVYGWRLKVNKYNLSPSTGDIVDLKSELDLEDDAAYVNWGASWRMPTEAQLCELKENCIWTWTQLEGVNGYEITGSNGYSIFLPAAGHRSLMDLNYVNSEGYYWSRDLYTSYSQYALNLLISSRKITPNNFIGRDNGLTVRAVRSEAEWIDLGLPSGTLWATWNIGANSPEELGDCFAWGETSPKEVYDWSTYKWGCFDTMTKYCSWNYFHSVDNKLELDLEDDAAYINWGPKWCMPTLEQQEELLMKCTWTKTTYNGVSGSLVRGPNGKTLFLPSAIYWSRTRRNYDMVRASCGMIDHNIEDIYPYVGHIVRPVRISQD